MAGQSLIRSHTAVNTLSTVPAAIVVPLRPTINAWGCSIAHLSMTSRRSGQVVYPRTPSGRITAHRSRSST